MTREEAIAKWKDRIPHSHDPGTIIDGFVALGMLKLEEPDGDRRHISKLCAVLDCGPNWLANKLDGFGLKIVEK